MEGISSLCSPESFFVNLSVSKEETDMRFYFMSPSYCYAAMIRTPSFPPLHPGFGGIN